MKPFFIFDLDGTVTSEETLPVIAKAFSVESQISNLTAQTVVGNVPFVESFIRRVNILGKLPVSQVNKLLSTVSLYPKVAAFIDNNKEQCAIATGNLRCWITDLGKKVGCEVFASEARVENDEVVKLTSILRKESVVRHFQEQGYRVVFIGEGNNDLEAMRIADVAIAFGATHAPANSVLSVADYLVYTEEALCRQMYQLF